MNSIYRVIVDTPYISTANAFEVGYVIGKEKAEQLKNLTIQKIKHTQGWQSTYKQLLNGEPAVFILKVCDLLDF